MSLPGDGDPPRVSADISLDWQTWSQSAWRSISMGEQVDEPPEIGIEVVFRVQRLASGRRWRPCWPCCPRKASTSVTHLARSAPVIEEAYEDESAPPEVAVEVSYEGSYRLPAPSTGEAKEMSLFPGRSDCSRHGNVPSAAFWRHPPGERSHGGNPQLPGFLGGLDSVRLADLDLEYLPPVEPDAS